MDDLPATAARYPSVGPYELAPSRAFLGPGFAALSNSSIAEEAHVDIIGFVAEEGPGPGRRFLNCGFLVQQPAVEHPNEVFRQDALHNRCIIGGDGFSPSLL